MVQNRRIHEKVAQYFCPAMLYLKISSPQRFNIVKTLAMINDLKCNLAFKYPSSSFSEISISFIIITLVLPLWMALVLSFSAASFVAEADDNPSESAFTSREDCGRSIGEILVPNGEHERQLDGLRIYLLGRKHLENWRRKWRRLWNGWREKWDQDEDRHHTQGRRQLPSIFSFITF